MLKYFRSDSLVHLSHTDLDGFGCTAVSSALFDGSKDIRYRFVDYHEIGDVLEDIAKEGFSSILITDLNLSEDTAKFVDEHFSEKLLVDHHEIGKKQADRYDWYKLKEGMAATKLLYFFGEGEKSLSTSVSFFADIVSAYDMGRTDLSLWNVGAVLANYVTGELPVIFRMEEEFLKRKALENFSRKCLTVDPENAATTISLMESGLKQSVFHIDQGVDVWKAPSLDAKTFIAMSQGHVFDMAAERVIWKGIELFLLDNVRPSVIQYGVLTFFERHPEAVVINYSPQKRSLSIRSKNGKAREVALTLGGGGHPNAGGAPWSESYDDLVNFFLKNDPKAKIVRKEMDGSPRSRRASERLRRSLAKGRA